MKTFGLIATFIIAGGSQAFAQGSVEFCQMITVYLTGAPASFETARGEQISNSLWRANTSKDCMIAIRTSGTHSLSCFLNRGKPAETVNGFYENVKPAIENCISVYGTWSSNYEHKTEDGIELEETRWTREQNSHMYTITIGSEFDSKSNKYANHLAIRYR